jgi:hypothetical protein
LNRVSASSYVTVIPYQENLNSIMTKSEGKIPTIILSRLSKNVSALALAIEARRQKAPKNSIHNGLTVTIIYHLELQFQGLPIFLGLLQFLKKISPNMKKI